MRVSDEHAEGRWRELCYGVRDNQSAKHRLCYQQTLRDQWHKAGGEWQETEIVYFRGARFFLDGRGIARDQLRKRMAQ